MVAPLSLTVLPLVLLVADVDPIGGGVPWHRFDEVFRNLVAVPRRLDCSPFLLGNVAIQVLAVGKRKLVVFQRMIQAVFSRAASVPERSWV